VPELGTAFDAIVETALARTPDQRFDNASAMAAALETSARAAGLLVGHREVAELVKSAVGEKLEERRAQVRARLAHEPSVASVQFDPDGEGPTINEDSRETLVNPVPMPPMPLPAVRTLRSESRPRIAKVTADEPLGSTLRSEASVPPSGSVSRRSIEVVTLPRKRGGWLGYVLTFVAISAAVAGGIVGVARYRGMTVDAAPTASASPPPVATSAASAAPAAKPAPSPSKSAPPVVASAPAPSASASAVPAHRPAAAPKRPGCTPNYFYDDNHERHYKPECFGTPDPASDKPAPAPAPTPTASAAAPKPDTMGY
jgi:hypothetical protein